MTDDPSSVADALATWSDASNVFEDTDDDRLILATAARLLREHAERLAAAEARAEESALASIEARNPGIDMDEVRASRATKKDQEDDAPDWYTGYRTVMAERDEAHARLAALTDAIGHPHYMHLWADALDPESISGREAAARLRRIAAAVQPPDSTPPPTTAAEAAFPFIEVDGVEWCYIHDAEYVEGNPECGSADEYPCMTIPLFYRAGDS